MLKTHASLFFVGRVSSSCTGHTHSPLIKKFFLRGPLKIDLHTINTFISISSFSWPCCVQALLSLNCLKVNISEFLYNLLLVSYGDNEIKKSKKLCIGLEIRPQTALICLRFVQTAANSFYRRFRRANQPVKNIYRWFWPHDRLSPHPSRHAPLRQAKACPVVSK